MVGLLVGCGSALDGSARPSVSNAGRSAGAAPGTASSGATASGEGGASSGAGAGEKPDAAAMDRQLRMLEKEFDATLGVFVLDTGSGYSIGYHADQRFAYASTFKALQAGVLLQQRSDQELDKVIRYRKADLEEFSPITKDHVKSGLSLRALADASVRYSDNTAANLLFRELGGPRAIGAALARIGDRTTHMDRIEPLLNQAVPGDVRDTSTPRALATDLRKFVLGDALDSGDRTTLTDLLRRNTTGDKLIRAGVPRGWVVGDKTGAGSYGTRNDIAVLWPPNAAPIVLAILSNRDEKAAGYDDTLIAKAAEVALSALR
jgi:beta-lactamase class A